MEEPPRVPADPRLDRLAEALAAREPVRVPREAGHVEAAVSLLLRPRDALEVLLVRRAERDSDPWSGHVGLPGGRRADEDADLAATALRETEEETGIAVAREGRTLGFLDEVEPAGPGLPPIVIAPLVGVVGADVEPEIDPRELVEARWAPLPALAAPAARDRHRIRIEGRELLFPAIRYDAFLVWGLTYRILTGFLDLVDDAGG